MFACAGMRASLTVLSLTLCAYKNSYADVHIRDIDVNIRVTTNVNVKCVRCRVYSSSHHKITRYDVTMRSAAQQVVLGF